MLKPTPVHPTRSRSRPGGRRLVPPLERRPYYQSPLDRSQTVSRNSGNSSLYSLHSNTRSLRPHLHSTSVVQPTYIDHHHGDRRFFYVNNCVSHSTYADEEVDDDASMLLSTTADTTHDILGALDGHVTLEPDYAHHSAPALCLTPRFLASKRRYHGNQDDFMDNDIMAESTDSLDQILEDSNHSLLKGPDDDIDDVSDDISDDVTDDDVSDDGGDRRKRHQAAGRNTNRQKRSSDKPEQNLYEFDKNNPSTLASHQGAPRDVLSSSNREYSLVDWTLRPISNMHCVIVEGMRTGAGEKVLWRSTAIKKALDKRTLETGSGSLYKLIGPMDVDTAEGFGFSSTLCRTFKNGFPKNWEELIIKHFDSKTVKKVDVKRKPVVHRPKPEIRNGPVPGSRLDLSTCERTRSGRVVVPSNAVAWWKGVRIYTTPKTPLEIRIDTPIENQLDSPLAWPLTNKRPTAKTGSNSSFMRKTPKVTTTIKNNKDRSITQLNSSKNESKTDLNSTNNRSKNEPKSSKYRSKVEENSTEEKTTKSEKVVRMKSSLAPDKTDSDSARSEKNKRPVRKVAAQRKQENISTKTAEPLNTSVIVIEDTVKKKSPTKSSLIRSPYTYPAHRTRNSSNRGANEKFRQLFVSDSDKSCKSKSDSEARSSVVNEKKNRSTSVPERRTKVGNHGNGGNHGNCKSDRVNERQVQKCDSEDEFESPRLTRGRQQKMKEKPKTKLKQRACVILSDINADKTRQKNVREESRTSKRVKPKPKPKIVPEPEIVPETEVRRGLRTRKAKPIIESETESDSSDDSSEEETKVEIETRAKKETKSSNRRKKVSDDEYNPKPVSRIQPTRKSKKEVDQSCHESSDTEIDPDPDSDPDPDTDPDTDTDEEIYAARTRVKEKQETMSKTINRSLGLNRSVKRQKNNEATNSTVSVDGVNEYGEVERMTWTESEVQRFRKALSTVPASTDNYWFEISAVTRTKDADQCRAFHLRDVPTSIKKTKVQKPTVLPKLVRDESSETVRVELSGGKGTFKRKRQMKTLLDHMNQEFDNDYFKSTPWSRKQRRIEVVDEVDTPGPSKFHAVNTPSTRLALLPRSERKTPVSSFISPGTTQRQDQDELYIHRCVQQMRGKIGKTQRVQIPKVKPSSTTDLHGGTKLLMELSQSENQDGVDSDQEEDDYFSDDEN